MGAARGAGYTHPPGATNLIPTPAGAHDLTSTIEELCYSSIYMFR